MMTNVRVKTCLNQKIIKNSNLIQAMKNSVCPKGNVIRRPNFSESRISRSVDSTHHMIIVKWREVTRSDAKWREVTWSDVKWREVTWSDVKWREVTWSDTYSIFPKAEFVRIFTECSVAFRSVDWTHDMIIVKWHLFIWHEHILCALTNAPPVQSTQTGQWLSTLFHANCSATLVYVLYPRQFIFPLSCGRRSFLQVL